MTVELSIVHVAPPPLTVISPLSPSATLPDITISPLHRREVEFIVLMFVPDTSVSCLLVASHEYCEFVALSPVFVPL